jgi:CrcB protein
MSRLGGGDLLATAIVNIVGSFAIMLFATLTGADGRFPAGPTVRQFVMAGLCGGYTTRSLQGLNTFILILDGHWFYGAAYVVAVVALSLAAAAVGYAFALGVNKSAALRPVAECRALS